MICTILYSMTNPLHPQPSSPHPDQSPTTQPGQNEPPASLAPPTSPSTGAYGRVPQAARPAQPQTPPTGQGAPAGTLYGRLGAASPYGPYGLAPGGGPRADDGRYAHPTQPTGQYSPYPPATGQYAAPQASPSLSDASGPAPARRRRAALIVTLVVAALVLVAGTATVTTLLLSDDKDGPTSADGASGSPAPSQSPTAPAQDGNRWSSAWGNGVKQVWTLDAPSSGSRNVTIGINDDKLVRFVKKGDDFTTVTVFRLGQGTPAQLWEDTVQTGPNTIVWQGKIVTGNTVIDIESRGRSTASWDAQSTILGWGGGIFTCAGTHCEMWTSLTEKKWETTIKVAKQAFITPMSRVGSYVIGGGFDTDDTYFAVNTDTGESKPINQSGLRQFPTELSDGWLVHDEGDITNDNDDTISLYDPDGTPKETFPLSTGHAAYPWSPVPLTVDQARAWLKDGDTSWAPSTFSASTTDTTCQSITVAGKDVRIGLYNQLVEDKDGRCVPEASVNALVLSGSGPVIARYMYAGTNTFSLRIIDMTTGASPDPVPLGGKESGYLLNSAGDLLVTYDDVGKMTAYQPA